VNIDLKKLSIFIAVAEELSFSKAARKLGLGQPVVSRAIQEIEKQVGTELFLREASSIRLTPAGEAFLPRVDEALLSLEQGLAELRQAVSKCGTAIDVAYLPSAYASFVGDAFSVFRQAFPETELTPHPLEAGPMLEQLRDGKLDIALIGHICPEMEKEFDVFHLYDLPMAAVVSENHPLAQQGQIRLQELADFPLISLASQSYPGRHELILGTLRKAGVHPQEVRRADNLLAALARVAGSQAYTLMPMEVKTLASEHVRFIPLHETVAQVASHAMVRRGESRKQVLTLLNECRRIAQARCKAS
jgi:DNA-binding transcriptional LysR family regulator